MKSTMETMKPLNSNVIVVKVAGLPAQKVALSAPTKPVYYVASKKLAHIDFDGVFKTPRVAFDRDVHMKFNPETMFHPIWESSNFYDLFGNTPYVEMSFFGEDNALEGAVAAYETVGRRGYFKKMFGETYRVLFGDWDDHGTALLVPVKSAVKTLKDLGLTINIGSKADKAKVRKYMRRIHAHHEWAVSGKPMGSYAVNNGQVLAIECAGILFDVLHVDTSKFVDERNHNMADGIHLVDVGLLHAIGNALGIPMLQRMEVGDAFKGTELDGCGLGKGFFHVVKMDTFGIIIYSPKKQISFDKFFFGSLGEVKGGAARTCIQSIGAFITEETKDLWVNQMILFVSQLMDSLHDEKKIKHLFLSTVGSLQDVLENNDRPTWLLVEAIRNGVPILHNPGLFRRVVRYLMNTVLQCEKGRIPYGDVAHRYNLMPDLTCFDFETGDVDWHKSVIPEGGVVCMDANQGPFAMYRQPLGNAKEAVVCTNIHNRRFRRFIGKERIVVGPSLVNMTDDPKMGGYDFDDSAIGTDNLSWIEVIAKAEYPVTPLPEAQAEALNEDLDTDNRWLDGGVVEIMGQKHVIKGQRRGYPTTWSMVDYFEAAAEAFNPQLSIGPVDNAVRLDLLLSGVHKVAMLRDLTAREKKATGAEKAKLRKAILWLEDREDFQLREVGSNLESFIDFVKMRKGDENVIAMLTKQINELASSTMVFPDCWTWLGGRKDRPGRVPQSRKDADDYVTARDLVSETLAAIMLEHAKLMEELKKEEWTMVQRPPVALRAAFPRIDGYFDEAQEMRILYRTWWLPFIMGETVTESDKANKIILDGGVVTLKEMDEAGNNKTLDIQGINPKFNQWKNDEGDDPEADHRLALAAEIAFQTYRNRYTEAERGESGQRRSYKDGLLWSNTIGLWYIEALKLAGLTGLYLPVKFDRYSADLKTGVIEIRLVGGMVMRKSDGFLIGYVISEETPEDGDYIMEDGIVTITEPSIELTEGATDVDEEYANPVNDDQEDQA